MSVHASEGGPASTGREAELARLLAELEAAGRVAAAPRVVFLRGPQGIGKTFLLRLLRREAAARGARVFEASAERRAARAYGLFGRLVPEVLEALAELGVPERHLVDLDRRTAPVTGRPAHAAPTRTHEARRLDLFDAVADALLSAGVESPPVYLFDEVDAADEASLELLSYVLTAATAPAPGARGGQGRALLVVALRDGGPLPSPLEDLLARIPATTVPVGGLDLGGLRAFLTRPATAQRLLESTGGVPERIEALLAGREAEVGDLTARRLARLAAPRRAVLEVLAVLGRPAAAPLVDEILSRLGEASAGEAARTLEQLAGDHLVASRFADGGPVFDLARTVDAARVLGDLDPAARLALHRAAGEALAARQGADPTEVARHLLVADPEGAGHAFAVKAGEALTARLAFAEAARAYEDALAVLPDRRGARAADLYHRLFDIHLGMAEYARALSFNGRLRSCATGDAKAVRRARAEAAGVCLAMGRPALAERLCRTVLGAAARPDPEDPVSVRAFADLAEAAWARGDYDRAATLAEDGLAATGGAGERGLDERLLLRNTLGKVALHRGDYARAHELFGENAAAAGDRPRERARALNNLGVVAQRQGKRREALDHYRASLELRAGEGDRSREAFALQNVASLYHESGELAEALDHYHRALAGFTRAGNRAQVARTAGNLANLYVFLGDHDRAASLVAHARAVADAAADPYLVGYAHLVTADLARDRGDTASARTGYEAALSQFTRIDSPRYAAEARLSLATLCTELGEQGLAERHLAAAREAVAPGRFPGLAAVEALVTSELALARDDLDGATRALGRARSLLLDAPDLEGPVRLYHLLGRLDERRGETGAAEVHFARAARLQDELAAGLPVGHRTAFLSVPRRRAVQAAADGREITPDRVRRALALEPAPARLPAPAPSAVPGIVGTSPGLVRVLSVIDRVAAVSTPVLVRGESGTGKELVADAIHRASPRAARPFIKVNCAAMHDELLLSELFGHEKGAFTGAVQARKGRFELADGGTLFLDEIGDISPKAQAALLRVLQHGTLERVGGNRTISVDVRLVCATNRDLERMMADGSFREDLYYRLKGAMLELPPLRDRPADLPVLVEHFLQRVATERGETPKRISPEVMSILSAYRWPGNIRELENVVQSLSLFTPGPVIGAAALEHHPELLEPTEPATARAPTATTADFFSVAQRSGLSLKDLKQEIERQCIRRALEEAQGNISEAARLLGMKRSRLSQIVNADAALKALAGSR